MIVNISAIVDLIISKSFNKFYSGRMVEFK